MLRREALNAGAQVRRWSCFVRGPQSRSPVPRWSCSWCGPQCRSPRTEVPPVGDRTLRPDRIAQARPSRVPEHVAEHHERYHRFGLRVVRFSGLPEAQLKAAYEGWAREYFEQVTLPHQLQKFAFVSRTATRISPSRSSC